MFANPTFILKIGLVMCVISGIFQVLGVSCPGWIVVSIDLSVIGTHVGSGILGYGEIVTSSAVWYTRVCIYGDNEYTCSTSANHEARFMGFKISPTLTNLTDVDWLEVEIELTLALVVCCIGIFLAALSLCQAMKMSPKVFSAISSASMFLSGVMILPAVIKVGLSIQDTNTALTISGLNIATIRVPWALALSATAIIISFISSTTLIIAACKQNEQTSMAITPDNTMLPPALLRMGHFPPNIYMSSEETNGHIPPVFKSDRLPKIGSKDDAPIEGMDNNNLYNETTFGPYVLYPPPIGQSSGYMYHLDDVPLAVATPPPSYEEYDPNTKNPGKLKTRQQKKQDDKHRPSSLASKQSPSKSRPLKGLSPKKATSPLPKASPSKGSPVKRSPSKDSSEKRNQLNIRKDFSLAKKDKPNSNEPIQSEKEVNESDKRTTVYKKPHRDTKESETSQSSSKGAINSTKK